MKVNEFAKKLGIPPSKVRYYDREGITKSGRCEDNNYREFTPLDALDICNAQMLRSFDMSVREAVEAGRSYPLGQVSQWLDGRIDTLEQEIRLEEIRLARLRQLKRYLLTMEQNRSQVHLDRTRVSYNVWTIGDVASPDHNALRAVELLQQKIPFSYVTLAVPKESLLGTGDQLSVGLGLGILEENMSKCGMTNTVGMERFDEGECLSIFLELEDPFALLREHLQPIFDEAKRRNLRLISGAVGRHYFSYARNGRRVHGFSLGVLVEKK